MSRYRPPREKSTPYVTPTGQRVLADELKFLWKQKRPEVTAKVAEAAAMGDRSENAEYIYGKKQLREIDGRIRYLSKRLDELVVVDRTPGDTDLIYFGAWVEVRDQAGDSQQYRIVGADEFDREPCYISVDAPVARALLKKRVGDAVEVAGPDAPRVLEVISIRYDEP
jgi:transcription elongation factor GreB